jgi:hypothetical protein
VAHRLRVMTYELPSGRDLADPARAAFDPPPAVTPRAHLAEAT